MTKGRKKDADLQSAHQQLLKMLQKGFLTQSEFAEAEELLKQLLKSSSSPDRS